MLNEGVNPIESNYLKVSTYLMVRFPYIERKELESDDTGICVFLANYNTTFTWTGGRQKRKRLAMSGTLRISSSFSR